MAIHIDLVADFVCPWCFVGHVRLQQALNDLASSHPELELRVNWLPFFLNPDTPADGEPYQSFLERKFGSEREAAAVLERVSEAAAADGIQFAFDAIRTRPNTLHAHRLMHHWQSRGYSAVQVDALADELFAAHFQRGQDLGDKDLLAEIAARCGGEQSSVRQWLGTDEDIKRLQRLADSVRRQGIDSVPFYILNRKMSLRGAQSAAILGAAILQAIDTRLPS